MAGTGFVIGNKVNWPWECFWILFVYLKFMAATSSHTLSPPTTSILLGKKILFYFRVSDVSKPVEVLWSTETLALPPPPPPPPQSDTKSCMGVEYFYSCMHLELKSAVPSNPFLLFVSKASERLRGVYSVLYSIENIVWYFKEIDTLYVCVGAMPMIWDSPYTWYCNFGFKRMQLFIFGLPYFSVCPPPPRGNIMNPSWHSCER